MLLSRMVFISRNGVKIEDTPLNTIKAILSSVSEYSPTSGLTGGLAFNERHFVQVTEGARDQLSRLLKKLMSDERHHDLTLLSFEPIDRHEFEGWAVGYAGHTVDVERLALKYSLGIEIDPTRISYRAIIGFIKEFAHLDVPYVQRAGLSAHKAPPIERIKVIGPVPVPA